jgi:hypothetical protein
MIRSMTFSAFVLFSLTTYSFAQNMPPEIVITQNGLNSAVRELQKVIPELLKSCEKKCDGLKQQAMGALSYVAKSAETLKQETDKKYLELARVCRK